jgi:hypothetical protein
LALAEGSFDEARTDLALARGERDSLKANLAQVTQDRDGLHAMCGDYPKDVKTQLANLTAERDKWQEEARRYASDRGFQEKRADLADDALAAAREKLAKTNRAFEDLLDQQYRDAIEKEKADEDSGLAAAERRGRAAERKAEAMDQTLSLIEDVLSKHGFRPEPTDLGVMALVKALEDSTDCLQGQLDSALSREAEALELIADAETIISLTSEAAIAWESAATTERTKRDALQAELNSTLSRESAALEKLAALEGECFIETEAGQNWCRNVRAQIRREESTRAERLEAEVAKLREVKRWAAAAAERPYYWNGVIFQFVCPGCGVIPEPGHGDLVKHHIYEDCWVPNLHAALAACGAEPGKKADTSAEVEAGVSRALSDAANGLDGLAKRAENYGDRENALTLLRMAADMANLNADLGAMFTGNYAEALDSATSIPVPEPLKREEPTTPPPPMRKGRRSR